MNTYRVWLNNHQLSRDYLEVEAESYSDEADRVQFVQGGAVVATFMLASVLGIQCVHRRAE